MLLLISYDLNGYERPSAYTAVREAIESHARAARPILYSQWLVETDDDVDTWARRLQPVIDNNDRLFICRVQGRTNGWLDPPEWPWINARAK